VKVGTASGPGVGAGVALAGGTDPEGSTLVAADEPALEDGEALGEPKRHPERSRAASRQVIGAWRRIRAA
jgi:hypothetical protein